ncbi:helix-turn-helix domain-containing protein [Pseudobutyrivibrio xylanivorans]|uniref:Helix-turn-helix transcriptional regulator n=1 Tax=Pseudobutyrivibrio xylanivorans TaxID=185007 RepID=A0A5P6VQD4_PSEXY|nr:helix-turn-helix transcriptional regulator [Pseudobutyrivibrio xylanivorans]QFJ54797.1 helix-turn-helix transcriptional regulator [Pseudobutyrivibrio xylanivorans]
MSENTIAERLKIARENLGITKAEASRRLNLTKIGYGRYESGDRTPSIQTLEVIAQCFNTSVAFLTGETDDMTSDKIVIDKKTSPELFNLVNLLSHSSDDAVQRLTAYANSIISQK